MYRCPACHQLTSENYVNEDGKIACQGVVNKGGKFVMCAFVYFINEYNTINTEGVIHEKRG